MLVKSYSLKRVVSGLLVGTVILGTPMQAAACQLIRGSAPTAPLIEYDVYGFDSAIASTDIDLRNAGETNCVLDIIIEDLASFPPPFNFTQAGVDIDVIAPGLQRPQDGQNINGIFELTLPPGVSEMVQLDFFTDQIISVPSGFYNRDIMIGIRRSGSSEMLETYITNLSLTSRSQAQVNIAGAAGTFNKNAYMDSIDFGEPEIGESQRVYVQARSNAMATMTIRSENGGVMKHDTSPNSTIGYGASLDGQVLNLSAPYIIPNLSSTDLKGKSQSLDLTIESLNRAFSGQYSDRIVIEIEAQ